MPREGTETVYSEKTISKSYRHLEIRCPERGRKLISFTNVFIFHKFGNKMPREGTETRRNRTADAPTAYIHLEIRCPERGRKQYLRVFLSCVCL